MSHVSGNISCDTVRRLIIDLEVSNYAFQLHVTADGNLDRLVMFPVQ